MHELPLVDDVGEAGKLDLRTYALAPFTMAGVSAEAVEVTAAVTVEFLGFVTLARQPGETIHDAITLALSHWLDCNWERHRWRSEPLFNLYGMRDGALARIRAGNQAANKSMLTGQARLVAEMITLSGAPDVTNFRPAGGIAGTCNGIRVVLPSSPAGRVGKGGPPRGSRTVQPVALAGSVIQVPANGAMAFALESLAASRNDWKVDLVGRPEYRAARGSINGSVVYLRPGDDRMRAPVAAQAELEAACASLWDEVAGLGAGEMQLLMFLISALAWNQLLQQHGLAALRAALASGSLAGTCARCGQFRWRPPGAPTTGWVCAGCQ